MAYALVEDLDQADIGNGTAGQTHTSDSVKTGDNGFQKPSEFVITYFAWAATWGTGSPEAKLQVSADGTKWFDVADTVVSTDTAINITVGGGVYIRGVVTSGTGTDDINIYISD